MNIHRYIAESGEDSYELYFDEDPGIDIVTDILSKSIGNVISVFDVFPLFSSDTILVALGRKESTIQTRDYDLTILDRFGNEINISAGTSFKFIDHGHILYYIE